MDILEITLFVMTGIVLAILIVATAYLIVRSVGQGRQLQQGLEDGVSGLRLKRMLQKRHIDVDEYLHRENSSDIREQIRRCESCDSLDECDHYLGTAPGKTKAEPDFCPNQAVLDRITEKYGH